MNSKLRALGKNVSKNKVVTSVPIPDDDRVAKEDPLTEHLARKRMTDGSCPNEVKDGTINDPAYKMSEMERKRRLLTKYRETAPPTESLTPYELALREQKRDEEK